MGRLMTASAMADRPVVRRMVRAFSFTSCLNESYAWWLARFDSSAKAANAMAMPIKLTGTLWKLRAKDTDETLPAASVVAENVVAIEIARTVLEKFAGDTLQEVRAAYEAYLAAARAL